MVGGFHGMLLPSVKHSRSLVCLGIPFGAMVEYHPISAKDLSRLHQLGPGICMTRGENLERRHLGRRH